jgi:hypothetical protein
MNVSVSCYGLVRWKINDLTAAYQSGDCPTALREWIPLAKREDVGAKKLSTARCIVLVGRQAQKVEAKIDLKKYQIFWSYHPSPRVKYLIPNAWEAI